MNKIDYILCHGSGNRFVMIDGVERDCEQLQTPQFVQKVCQSNSSDGVLFLVREPSGHYAMQMFNTDGTRAEMCGNGIRCVARLARERYGVGDVFGIESGGRVYATEYVAPVAAGVETYSVDIPIRTSSPDFTLTSSRFVGKRIEALDSSLYFTYLNLGNPHIVAMVDEIDLEHLSALGERVKKLKSIFPYGVNVSEVKYESEQQIFVATYERGVGLTPSCGTAMTASCTASTLLGVCREEREVKVRNRGGEVRCTTSLEGGITTRLTGNATFDAVGAVDLSGNILELTPVEKEREAWANFVNSLERE